jgi:hypothetical protein
VRRVPKEGNVKEHVREPAKQAKGNHISNKNSGCVALGKNNNGRNVHRNLASEFKCRVISICKSNNVGTAKLALGTISWVMSKLIHGIRGAQTLKKPNMLTETLPIA